MTKRVLDGGQHFCMGQQHLEATIGDFWAWSMSRLLADGPRGDLAEFIVNVALGSDMTIPKRGWGECDIVYRGKRVEVKCSSFLQEWVRPSLSKPIFGIAKTLPCDCVYDESIDEYVYTPRSVDAKPAHRSEVYVFCLFSETDRDAANPSDFSQWQFYIAPTSTIDEQCGNQRQISLQGLERIGAVQCDFPHLKETVDAVLGL